MAEARAEIDRLKQDAETIRDSLTRVESVADKQLAQVAETFAGSIRAERERDAARRELAAVRSETDQQLVELREDVEKLRTAAADTETGESVRGAIAYGVLRDLYLQAQAAVGADGALRRPYDVVATVLGVDAARAGS